MILMKNASVSFLYSEECPRFIPLFVLTSNSNLKEPPNLVYFSSFFSGTSFMTFGLPTLWYNPTICWFKVFIRICYSKVLNPYGSIVGPT